ncbi:hypothetical protein K525DRAFT_245666, partial [Schizophyllum commune Loenen D]
VFHARISHPTLSLEPHRVEFLWVRWFLLIDHGQSGSTKMRLERLQYLDGPSAFGFVDPSEVIRGCHLMPVFHRGCTRELLGPSLYRDSSEGDWASYYVGRKRFKLNRKTHNRYKDLGRIFGHDCEMWVPPLDVIQVGMACDPNHDPALFSLEDNLLYKVFLRLAQTAPDVIDHLNEINMQAEPHRGETLRAISRSINQGCKGACSDDVKGCKAALREWVCDWVPPLPTKKSKARFSHEKTGKLLLPVRQVWNKDTQIKCLNHEINCSPDALCRLLFANEEDDTVGFLKHELIVKQAARHYNGLNPC